MDLALQTKEPDGSSMQLINTAEVSGHVYNTMVCDVNITLLAWAHH